MSIAPENLVAYDVEVEDPRHIPDLVEATQQLGQYTPVLIGLDHQEGYEGRHAMRGRYEEFGELEAGENAFRRPDGGNTVYTDDSKYALNFGVPLEPVDQKKAQTLTDELHSFIDDRNDYSFQSGERDLYFGGDQIVGTSQIFGDESAVLRAYWAEEVPDVYDIMYQDGLSNDEIQSHQEAMEKSQDTMGDQDFYRKVLDEFHADELTSTEFLDKFTDEPGRKAEELLEMEGARERDVCFLTRPEE